MKVAWRSQRDGGERSKRTFGGVSPVVAVSVGFLLAANIAMSLWLLVRKVAEFPLVSGQPGPINDFIVRYAAGWMARHGQAAATYDELAYHAAQVQILPGLQGRMLWMHPPPALLAWAPISALPYASAAAAWLVLSAAIYIVMARKVVGRRWAAAAAFVFAGLTLDLLYTQNGAVLTGLLAAGLVLMRDRPALAGIPLGYILVKPHWAPVVLIALVAGRRWRAFASTVAVAGALYLTSVLVFGIDTWMAWFGQLDAGFKLIPELSINELVSPYSALQPTDPVLATVVQTVCTLGAFGAVAWVWHRERSESTRAAVLALALSVASPYLHFYDLAVLGIAVAWLARDSLDDGDPAAAVILFTLASSAVWFGRVASILFGVQVTPLLLVVALLALLRRP